MTGSLRSSARNPIAVALMAVLTLVFLVLGLGTGGRLPDLLNGVGANAVVSAGSHQVTSSQFRKIFDQQKQKLEQQSGQTFTPDFLVKNGFDRSMLAGIGQDQAEAEMLQRAGVVPAPELIDEVIKKIPDAFDRVTGKFSQAQFGQLLAAQGLTLKEVTTALSDQIAEQQLGIAVAGGVQAPRGMAALQAVAGLENRDVSYFLLTANSIPKPAAPTDAQLLAFEKANAAILTRPEMRTITLARFSAAAVAPSVKIDQAQIAKEFEARRPTLSSAETRSLVQIPVRDPRSAQAALQALSHGADPAAVARALHVEPIVYDQKPLSAVADKKIGAAAFAMKSGETKLVQGDLGVAVVKVTQIVPAHTPTLETERAKIEADLRQKAAQDQAYKQSEAFDQARQSGLSVVAAAQKVGAPVISVGPFDSKGNGVDGRPLPLVNDKIVKAAFAAGANEDTEIADAGPSDYFALHVDKVAPPALPPLSEARAQLAQAWTLDQVRSAFRAKAAALEAQIKAGTPLASVAAANGASVQHETGIELFKAQQYAKLGNDFLGAVFGTKAGEPFAAGAPGGAYIGRVDAIRPADAATAAQVTNAIRARLGQQYARDLVDTVRTASQSVVRVQANRKLALESLGLDPKLYGADNAKPAKPGAAPAP